MSLKQKIRFLMTFSVILTLTLFALKPSGTSADSNLSLVNSLNNSKDRQRVGDIEFLGMIAFETGFLFNDTEVGGLSGLAYDANRGVYFALSDDRSQIDPARFYTLAIDLTDGYLNEGDVTFLDVTTLLDETGQPFAAGSIDPEGIALNQLGAFYISSEGAASAAPPLPPFVNLFKANGRQLLALPIPDKYLPDPDNGTGIRNNLAFESLTLSPNEQFLFTAIENALAQDGPAADLEQESLSRILQYDARTRQPVHEFVYITDAVAEAPAPPDAFRTNGLVELLALDNNGTLLALERSFSQGRGNSVKLYEAHTQGALDVTSEFSLFWEEEDIPFEIDPPVAKRLLLDFADLGITPDNLEGLSFGPVLPDGRQTLIVVSDNNFSPIQETQFIALALELDTIGAALPTLETPRVINDEAPPGGDIPGDSDDPAIWVHPTQPEKSLVITTLKDGGLMTLTLNGRVRQLIQPAAYSEIRYNNVDLVYGFHLAGQAVDLAVVSDRQNDTLVVYQIDPASRYLTDVTAPEMPDTIFGVDDGSQTAYGLTTYTSPLSGMSYAYVSQREGNLVAQLALADNGSGLVTASIARLLSLPVPTGDAEDSQAEGMVVDRELGFLYIALEAEVGILKFAAEPEAGDDYTVIHSMDEPYLQPDIEGLTIYYGSNGAGYLLVSSQGDSTFAVFERTGDNAYLGSFVVGDNGRIDQANESDGADVINVNLGSRFPYGLLVVQDGANDPQSVVQDDGELENNSTNFKFVPWQHVADAFPNPLLIDTDSYNPRN